MSSRLVAAPDDPVAFLLPHNCFHVTLVKRNLFTEADNHMCAKLVQNEVENVEWVLVIGLSLRVIL